MSGSNGFITVLPGQDDGCCSGDPFPSPADPNGTIGGFWRDLDPSSGAPGSGIFYQTIGAPGSRVFIVEYKDVPNCCENPSPDQTFEIKIFEGSNNIEAHYAHTTAEVVEMSPAGKGPPASSAGIENETGTKGSQFFYGEGTIPDNTAVRYSQDCAAPTPTPTPTPPPVSIAGNIRQWPPLTGLPGVTVNLVGSATGTTVTDANGYYQFINLPSGGTYLVRPDGATPPGGRVYDPTEESWPNLTTSVANGDFLAYNIGEVPRNLRVAGGFSSPPDPVSVPIILTAQGDERSLSASLSYPTSNLSSPTVSCGSASPGCNVVFSTTPGHVGFEITPTATWAAGQREVAIVTFQTTTPPTTTSYPIAFEDTPYIRRISDGVGVAGNNLPSTYTNGFAVLGAAAGLESDVTPRPTGSGGVDATDVALMRNFVAGLTTPPDATTQNEFQRADSAPRGTKGNGILNSGDVVQARRYAAASDPPTTAGGPFSPAVVGSDPSLENGVAQYPVLREIVL